MTTKILNIKINIEKKADILKQVELLLGDGKQHYIVTPNPEIVLYSVSDFGYLKILNRADIAICDGFGLKLASQFSASKIKEVIKGVDFAVDICRVAEQKKYSVYFLGSDGEVAEQASRKLKEQFPELIVVGADSGGKVDSSGKLQNEAILDSIKDRKPDILFVGFGHPKQEKFINRYQKDLSSVKLAMAVGGSFDFISGNIKRAPKIFQSLKMEWLYRLIVQPSRIGRIYDAVVKFPLVFLRWNLVVKPVYRKNVILCIFNKDGKVLLTKRKDRKNDKVLHKNDHVLDCHWQLPQGGTDNNDLETAAKREAKEEVNISTVDIIGFSKKTFTYLWPTVIQMFFKKLGQEQTVAYMKFNGEEGEIVCDGRECCEYRWVEFDALPEEVHFVRKKAAYFVINEFKFLSKK